jgi:hypothetical protein
MTARHHAMSGQFLSVILCPYANNLLFWGICDNIIADKPPPRFVLYDVGH